MIERLNSPEYYYASILTFKQLYDYTNNDLRLYGVNITRGIPQIFSHIHTPDMIVSEASCISMSIPGAFKPTLLTGKVYIAGDEDENKMNSYNQGYIGQYVDGGILVNLPIHLFDNEPSLDFEDFEKIDNHKAFNPNILGLRLTDNTPDSKYLKHSDHTDLNYRQDYYYNLFKPLNPKRKNGKSLNEKKIILKDFRNTSIPSLQLSRLTSNLLTSNIADLVSDIYNTWMYWPEDGQLANNPACRNAIELFCYDIDMFGFKPNPNLQKFVTIRGLIKTCRWLGYPIFETIEMLNESLLADDKIYVNYNAEPGFNRYTSLANKPIVEFLAGVYQISFDTMKGIIKFPISD